jgi:hypothetical protein
MELAEHIGAERHECTADRTGYRNGYRERPWDTRRSLSGMRSADPNFRLDRVERQLLREGSKTPQEMVWTWRSARTELGKPLRGLPHAHEPSSYDGCRSLLLKVYPEPQNNA